MSGGSPKDFAMFQQKMEYDMENDSMITLLDDNNEITAAQYYFPWYHTDSLEHQSKLAHDEASYLGKELSDF